MHVWITQLINAPAHGLLASSGRYPASLAVQAGSHSYLGTSMQTIDIGLLIGCVRAAAPAPHVEAYSNELQAKQQTLHNKCCQPIYIGLCAAVHVLAPPNDCCTLSKTYGIANLLQSANQSPNII